MLSLSRCDLDSNVLLRFGLPSRVAVPCLPMILCNCPSAITARWSSDTTNQSVTTPMIALDLSSTTHLSADHNVALSQILLRHGNFNLLNWLPRWFQQLQQELPQESRRTKERSGVSTMSSAPPVLLQTTTEINGNVPEKCSNEQ
ncbi:hypothetical protein F511_30324 [Dorcoceras hygrometricum]|uniref:Uncharacterized protein n=1 Tax=Dorcoceras hygrometricum TaxID=472368 RepID=A0A2Z7C4C6_9LAMI|nr:hypothetical protein F511_30324 [Dorcoceras hygrometricum]